MGSAKGLEKKIARIEGPVLCLSVRKRIVNSGKGLEKEIERIEGPVLCLSVSKGMWTVEKA